MKKVLAILFIFMITISSAEARKLFGGISSAIGASNVNKNSISVSFKNVKTGKKAYSLNDKQPVPPASCQKLITLRPALDVLGEDYEFTTSIYKNSKNEVYLKLGADPYFTTGDVKNLARKLKQAKVEKISAFYIDDSVLDDNEWGEGWQWDDELNPLMPKFSAYNIDSNLLTVFVEPRQKGAPAAIEATVFYPTTFMNYVTSGDGTGLVASRKNYISPEVVTLEGAVNKQTKIQIPVNYPRRYFIIRLEEALRAEKIQYYGEFKRLKLPQGLTLVAEVKHPVNPVFNSTLLNSDNMVAETVFKLAGGKFTGETGSAQAGVDMLNSYFQKAAISTDGINLVDGSGVSKNNLLTSDFMTNYLVYVENNYKPEQFKLKMATPGVGTLKDRMLYFKGRLFAKTGTLSGISSLSGYLEARSGKVYAFSIINQDSKMKTADKKMLEEYILRAASEEL